ncbi:DUF6090 family protein [Winogradskyella sp.]|uniref:tetratricopeptide repeat protein n=1 Tax=Winogradskyella sp. TaxID=1883156 RepID=UPI0025DBC82D|nr:DUF6090 family protein [Winogradskyella sp.]
MIKFFRKIRQKLLSENKFSKYLLYAIGEIILVVIGILIALQINTWNELRKKEDLEKQVLKSLFQEIDKDRIMLNDIDNQYKNDLRYLTYFSNLIWKDKHSMEDALTLNEYRGPAFRDVNPNRITYDEMISTGKLYYLSSQNLVNNIINYYELMEDHVYKSRQQRVEFRANFFNLDIMNDFWLTVWDNNNKELAYSFANNQNSDVYKNLKVITKWSINNTQGMKARVANLHEKAKELQLLINEELEYSQILVDDIKPSDEKIIIDDDSPKNLSELASSGKNIDDIIKIIKNQDSETHNYIISEIQINRLGYELMGQDKNEDALKIFKLNTELYPNEFNTYDSYGECLLKLGDTENGVKAYQKSLELNSDNTNAKIVLSQFE